MKIDSNKPAGTPSSPSGAARTRPSQAGAAAAPAKSASQSTEATLSGAQSVDSVLASTPIVDTERVAEIKRAIAEGRFQVNPERIADGLLQSVRDMLATGR
ncbi:MAG TPA: flagellar biosynthesis anti-sigma factor FlgM [Rhodocyclaceae bacterium]|nr:flagellar biosynthesis anti-sigma factor FlgM [Rhodocyclaceae bacterium]